MGEIRIKSGNLFNVTTVTNMYLDVQGVEHSSEVSRTSDYIPVTANTLYTLGMTGGSSSLNLTAYCFYDSNKEFISSDTYRPSTIGNIVNITTPNNCAYFRFTYNYLRNLIEFVSGVYNTFPPYFLNRPAHQYINGEWIDIPTHHFINNRWQGELTSQSPLKFRADGEMLDWRVEGRKSGNLWDGTFANTSAYQISFSLDDEGYMVGSSTNDTRGWGYDASQIKMTLSAGTYSLVLQGIAPTQSWSGARVYTSGGSELANNRNLVNKPLIIMPFTLAQETSIGIMVKVANGKYRVQLLEGTYTSDTLPPYEPYGGVGDYDETEQKYRIPVTVRCGNLYSGAWKQGFWSYDTGVGWGTDSKYVRTAKMPCEGNTKYEFVCSLPDGSKDYGFVFWDANGNYIGNIHSSDVQNTPVKYTAVSPANAKTMAVNIARYSDGERHPADILSFDFYELHEVNLFTDHQLMDGDSIDFTTDQTAIPIATGNNTLTVDTAVQPKSVFVKFEG